MSKFPVFFDNTRLFVNPTKISVKKTKNIAQLRVLSGTVFQVWPDLPDTVSFEGTSFGISAPIELRLLQEKQEKQDEVLMTYKFKKYRGFFLNFNVVGDAEMPSRWAYSFDFIMKDRFKTEDFTIGHLDVQQAIVGVGGLISQSILKFKETIRKPFSRR